MSKLEEIYKKGLKDLDESYKPKTVKRRSSEEPYLRIHKIHTPKMRKEQ